MTILRSVFYALAIWRLAPESWRPYMIGFVFGIPAIILALILIGSGLWLPVLIVWVLWHFVLHHHSRSCPRH